MSDLAERIQSRLDRLGLSPQAASKAAGMGKDGIRNILRGKSKSPRFVNLAKLARVLECEPDWLGGHEGNPPVDGEARSLSIDDHGETVSFRGLDYAAIPVFDIRASAGPGAINGDGAPLYAALHPMSWIRSHTAASVDKLAVIRVSGDSMWETLHDGDHVLVDRAVRKVGRDGIYVLRAGDELMVKRVQRQLGDKRLMVISDNPRYQPQIGVRDEDVDIIGRVVWLGRNVGG